MEAEAAKFFEQKSGSGSGGGAKDLEVESFLVKNAEAEAFFFSILEAEAEANFFSKKFWKGKRKRIFIEKRFGSGSVFKINRFQNAAWYSISIGAYDVDCHFGSTGSPPKSSALTSSQVFAYSWSSPPA